MLARVIKLANDPSVGVEQIATIVASDLAFSAELMRTANSPFYGAAKEVRTVQRAMVQLGGRTVRCLAVCFAVRDIARDVGLDSESLADFWEDSLRRGVAARRIARVTRAADPEEAFTCGLLLEFGLLILLKLHPTKLAEWKNLRRLLPEARRRREAELFSTTHDRIAKDLGGQWGLPDALVSAIAHHHNPTSSAVPRGHVALTRIAGIADMAGAVYTALETNAALTETRERLHRELNLDAEAIDALMKSIGGDVLEAAQALSVRVRKQPSFDELIVDANRALAAMNLSYEELTVSLERALQEKERLAEELGKANKRLQELVYYDPLTSLANRRRFEEQFLAELTRGRTARQDSALLLFDLDHFKHINDNYGHPFGDQVLVAVAKVLLTSTRPHDVKARIGGEEMAVLLPGILLSDARILAERLRKDIESLDLRCGAVRVPVSTSIGAVMAPGGGPDGPTRMRELIAEADRSLYAAKRAGRNRIVWTETGVIDAVETF